MKEVKKRTAQHFHLLWPNCRSQNSNERFWLVSPMPLRGARNKVEDGFWKIGWTASLKLVIGAGVGERARVGPPSKGLETSWKTLKKEAKDLHVIGKKEIKDCSSWTWLSFFYLCWSFVQRGFSLCLISIRI